MLPSDHKAGEGQLVIKPALIPIEGPRRRPEGGREWEPIKILQENLVYILKTTQINLQIDHQDYTH